MVDVVHCETLADDVMEPVTGEEPEGPAVVDSAEVDSAGVDSAVVDSAGVDLAGVDSEETDWAGGVLVIEVVVPAGEVSPVEVSVTGQTVVRTGMVEVTTVVESAGQFVTVGAQLVMVTSLVVYIVEVIH